MTLSTSAIDRRCKLCAHTAMRYLLISIWVALLGAIYELFSHEVYSFFMIYAFAFPLAGGTLPFLALSLLRPLRFPDIAARRLYHCGIATLTVGSVVRGVLDIYGTTNALVSIYWGVGAVLIIGGVGWYCFHGRINII